MHFGSEEPKSQSFGGFFGLCTFLLLLLQHLTANGLFFPKIGLFIFNLISWRKSRDKSHGSLMDILWASSIMICIENSNMTVWFGVLNDWSLRSLRKSFIFRVYKSGFFQNNTEELSKSADWPISAFYEWAHSCSVLEIIALIQLFSLSKQPYQSRE